MLAFDDLKGFIDHYTVGANHIFLCFKYSENLKVEIFDNNIYAFCYYIDSMLIDFIIYF
jgi:hypothetical protein